MKMRKKHSTFTLLQMLQHCVLVVGPRPEAKAVCGGRDVEKFGNPWTAHLPLTLPPGGIFIPVNFADLRQIKKKKTWQLISLRRKELRFLTPVLITPEPFHPHHGNTLEGVGGAGNVGRTLYTASICQDVTDGAREALGCRGEGLGRRGRGLITYAVCEGGRLADGCAGTLSTPFQSGGWAI